MCLNNIEDYKRAVVHCNKALAANENSVKAYFIKSQSYQKMNEFENAIQMMKKCIVLQPNDKKLRDDLNKLKAEEAKHN